MRFHAALSTARDLATACEEIAAEVRDVLGTAPLDLGVVFASPALGDLEDLPDLLQGSLPARHVIGASGGGVLAAGREIEDGPALAFLAARMPQVGIHVRRVTPAELPNPDAPPAEWRDLLGLAPDAARGFVVLPDPYSFPVGRIIDGLDYAYPDAPKVGGLASGGAGPGQNSLFADGAVLHDGAVILGISGQVRIEPVVAQGCKPVGSAGVVTRCSGQELIAVDSKPALAFLEEQLDRLDTSDLELARRAPMFLGLAMDPFAQQAPGAGDFLIRQILGLDRSSGTLTIGGSPRVGRTVRFHLRDRRTSADDLDWQLSKAGPTPAAALMFSCLGRGQHLYGERDHDSRLLRRRMGRVPLAGFFCNGEIGPVGGATHLHGYTSALALIHEVDA